MLEEEVKELLAAAIEDMVRPVDCGVAWWVVPVSEDHEEEISEAGGLPSQFTCFVDKLPTFMSKQFVVAYSVQIFMG